MNIAPKSQAPLDHGGNGGLSLVEVAHLNQLANQQSSFVVELDAQTVMKLAEQNAADCPDEAGQENSQVQRCGNPPTDD